MIKKIFAVSFFLGFFIALSTSTNAGIIAGRVIPDGRDAGIALRIGQIANLEASIKDQSKRTGFLRQDFSLKDLGIDGSYVTYGLSADKAWKFFGVRFDFLYFGISESATAQHSYNINVDSTDFGGVDYLRVDANTEINAEFNAGLAELSGLITPISLQLSDSVIFCPWISFGGTVLAGNYDLKNGTAQGVVHLGDLSESFSVGGSASGPAGIAVPEIGFGGELRVGQPEGINFVLNGDYSFLPGNGNADWLLGSQDSVSNLNLDYTKIKLNGFFELPLSGGKAWTVGIQFESIDSSASMDLSHGEYHASSDLKMTILTGSIGLRF